jgi:GTPase SAR1 family protein
MYNADNIYVSLPLFKHPLNEARDEIKSEYIGVLRGMVDRFISNGRGSLVALTEYAKHFNVECNDAVRPSDLTASIRRLTADPSFFNRSRFHTLRHCLICDILLFTAFNNYQSAKEVIEYIRTMLRKQHYKDVFKLIDSLYTGVDIVDKFVSAQYLIDCWQKNIKFSTLPLKRVLMTATMSAGKSTIINTMIGEDVLETRNEVCTSRVHRVFNKPFADGVTNRLGDDAAVFAEAFERTRISFIDTPGVNAARYPAHREITRTAIQDGQYNVIAYVINARYSGVADDDLHLRYILENKPPGVPVVFIFNQLDAFNENDSVSESISELHDWLCGFGIQEPVICPVSAKAGRLARKVSNGDDLTKPEKRLFEVYVEEFSMQKSDLSVYYAKSDKNEKFPLLRQCGIRGLENVLMRA